MRSQGIALVAMLLVGVMGTAWASGKEKVLHSFAGGGDGNIPVAGVLNVAGNLYGTTSSGGTGGNGTIFELTQSGGVWTESVLYSFAGGNDGGTPVGNLMRDQAGNLYGTTRLGGPANAGTVFKLAPAGNTWTESVLYAFTGGSDGGGPQAALTLHAGALYGTTPKGGATGNGTVFKLQKVNGVWQEQVLYSFAGGTNDGTDTLSQVVFDKLGNMYGTTNGGLNEAGAVFELQPSGTNWTETILYFFKGNSDGMNVGNGVVLDAAGNLYGVTESGGFYSAGTLFELTNSNGTWTEQVLYDFSGIIDGADPTGPLLIDKNGNLFGTTSSGGLSGYGTVFELALSSGTWTQTALYSFTDSVDGAFPLGGLLLKGGNLIGTAEGGGTAHVGVVFEVPYP